jgi:predicted ATP-dependent protease
MSNLVSTPFTVKAVEQLMREIKKRSGKKMKLTVNPKYIRVKP